MQGGGRVGVFDSGVGGLSVWREMVRQMPGVHTLYLADQAHVPYGSRTLSEVRAFSEGITRYLLSRGSDVIVVACNTASAAALHHLRGLFPDVPFVGMEPAVKPAAERTRTGVVGVIATEATFQGDLFASLISRYAGEVRVIPQICPGLVAAVEAGALETEEIHGRLYACLEPLLRQDIDQLVLGCTHYPFLLPAIQRIVGPGVSVIDPAPAVARQTVRVLQAAGARATSGKGSAGFYTTGDPEAFATMGRRLLAWSGDEVEVGALRWSGGSLIGRNGAG